VVLLRWGVTVLAVVPLIVVIMHLGSALLKSEWGVANSE